MRNFINFVIVCVFAMVSTSAMAETKPVVVKGEKVIIKGVSYDMSEYIFKDALKTIAEADYCYVFPFPEGSGDYCYMMVLENGNFGIEYGTTFYEFNSQVCNLVPKKRNRETQYTYMDYESYGNFFDNAFAQGKKIAYTYVDRGGENYIVVYGKR